MHEDFTDRVRLHRRELIKRLAQARNNGQYATLNFDKLIIENTVYGYNEESQDTYTIGPARGQPGTRFHAKRKVQANIGGNTDGNTRGENEQRRMVGGDDNPENEAAV